MFVCLQDALEAQDLDTGVEDAAALATNFSAHPVLKHFDDLVLAAFELVRDPIISQSSLRIHNVVVGCPRRSLGVVEAGI